MVKEPYCVKQLSRNQQCKIGLKRNVGFENVEILPMLSAYPSWTPNSAEQIKKILLFKRQLFLYMFSCSCVKVIPYFVKDKIVHFFSFCC
jgi:hypothetical protein